MFCLIVVVVDVVGREKHRGTKRPCGCGRNSSGICSSWVASSSVTPARCSSSDCSSSPPSASDSNRPPFKLTSRNSGSKVRHCHHQPAHVLLHLLPFGFHPNMQTAVYCFGYSLALEPGEIGNWREPVTNLSVAKNLEAWRVRLN